MPAVSISEKRILITGGARGLGASFAQAACEAGAVVAIADILVDRGTETARKLSAEGHKISFHELDLADAASIDRCAQAVLEALGGLDGLVNNGAIATAIGGKSMMEIDIETWDKVMVVNVRGTWLMTRACYDALKTSANGKVVNLTSDTALWGAPMLMHYVASKGAVISMTRAMANEMGEHGIAVNAIAPGLTDVEATEYVPAQRKQFYMDGRSIRRTQTPEDVVGAMLFMLSDAADFITGQVLPVNGGFVLN